ncbi:MAG TPA: ATP-dependent DNA ligase [Micromonosporaceae bacterium]|nr:ATP-dependent DNA ligase [Micromonosporaceae bacterium]
MRFVRFADLVETSAAVAATTKRLAKVELLANALRGLRGAPDAEVAAGAAYLSGELRQRQTGVGWASLRSIPAPADTSSLTVGDVDAAFAAIAAEAGPGSQARRRELVDALFGRATREEQDFLVRLIGGELRQGAQAGVLVDAIARAVDVGTGRVRRALLLSGSLTDVARSALERGAEGLDEYGLEVGRPLMPMLAHSAQTVAEALATTGVPAVVDAKLDGIRIQVHRLGTSVRVFTRSLDDITVRVPGVVAVAAALEATDIVLDGEAMALDDGGRPRPFQETSSAAATHADSGLRPYFFDLLHIDGEDLIDQPGKVRWERLAAAVPDKYIVDRAEVTSIDEASAAFDNAIAAGQEGVVVKALDAAYDVGRRGGGWVKVKPRHTLDLVVLAVERGHGRRSGWLSNLHLGARDPRTGGFVMLGKTFKGMTDQMLTWQTERLTELATGPVGPSDWVVPVRPELVVEIAFDGVQTSPRYPGGVALRFARVIRYREDKRADDADTIDAVRALHGRAPDG